SEPPIRPTRITPIRMDRALATGRRLGARGAPRPHGRCELVQHVDSRTPVEAAIGDRLAIDELLAPEVLAAADQERLEHHPDDRAVAIADLPANLVPDDRLTRGILAAVVVGAIDHASLRE